MRLASLAAVAVVLAAAVGCGDDEGGTSSGASGQGGAGTGGDATGGTSAGGSPGTGGSATGGSLGTGGSPGTGGGPGTGGAGGGADCIKCSGLLMPGADPTKLCPESQPIAQALQKCACEVNCKTECAQSCTTGAAPTKDCQTCVGMNCQAEFAACLNDK